MDPLDVASGLIGNQFPTSIAALLGGSALTNRRTATSDLDIVVVESVASAPYRRTIRAQGWLTELFVHTRDSLAHYWALDIAARRPPLLRMCAEGRILVSADGAAEVIQAEARQRLAAGPPPMRAEELELRRYRLTNMLDDLEGCGSQTELTYIAAELLTSAAELTLLCVGRWLGTGKWLPRHLAELDQRLADWIVVAHRTAIVTGDSTELRKVIDDVLDRAGGPIRDGYYAQATDSPS